jgi:hypothetical protein
MKTYQIVLFILLISGVLYANPYQTATVVGVTLQYRTSLDSSNLECILSAPATGWVAVGFNPSSGMMDGNFVFGFVMNNVLSIRDDWGTDLHMHASDTSLGGTDNIMDASGTEIAGATEISFTIPLNSGDAFDQALAIGQSYPILLAYGATDDFTSHHTDRGASTISIIPPVSNQDETATIDPNQFEPQIYPNPFHSETTIAFSVKNNDPVKLDVYNMKGQLVKSYGTFTMGKHQVQLNTSNANEELGSGVYLCRLENQTGRQTIKMLHVK